MYRWLSAGFRWFALVLVLLAGCRRPNEMAFQEEQSKPGNEIYFVPTTNRVVALTFDDGPNEPHTGAILDLLRDRGCKATFFLLGANVEFAPGTAARIVKEGHSVGNHSYSHPTFDHLTPVEAENEIRKTDDRIFSATGTRPLFFRPPHGAWNEQVRTTCRKTGHPVAGWSAEGRDWEVFDPEVIAERILVDVLPGAIILMHDGDQMNHGSDRSHVVKALGILIDRLQAQGYRVVSLEALLACASRPMVRYDNGVQLLDVGWHPDSVKPGGEVHMRYAWSCLPGFQATNVVAFVHVRSPDGRLVAQDDHPIIACPRMSYQPVRRTLTLDRNLSAGEYRVEIGLYEPGTKKRGDWPWLATDRLEPATTLTTRNRAICLPATLHVER